MPQAFSGASHEAQVTPQVKPQVKPTVTPSSLADASPLARALCGGRAARTAYARVAAHEAWWALCARRPMPLPFAGLPRTERLWQHLGRRRRGVGDDAYDGETRASVERAAATLDFRACLRGGDGSLVGREILRFLAREPAAVRTATVTQCGR
jgi:hypothetical protein